MKKDVTNAGKNTDDNNVWKRMSLMQVRILMIIIYEKGCTNEVRILMNAWKRMSLMQIRILMIIMYEKGCH